MEKLRDVGVDGTKSVQKLGGREIGIREEVMEGEEA